MKLKKLIYLLPIFIFSLSFSQSEEWKYIGESIDNTQFYYRNVEVDKHGYYRVWVKAVPESKSNKANYKVELWQLDCEENKYKPLTLINYNYENKIIISVKQYKDYSFIIPDSMADEIRKITCFIK